MNNFVEITSRIGRMYQDFLISGKGSGDIIEEIDKLSAELRRNGCVNSIFFETLLKQGFMFDMINYNKVAPSASQKSYVYVLHAEDSGLTKIGFSRRVNKRISEISRMTEEQKFQLEIYKLVMNQNAAAEEAFQFIGTDELKLELFKIHFQSGGANSDITTRTIEAVRKSKEALDLFTTGA